MFIFVLAMAVCATSCLQSPTSIAAGCADLPPEEGRQRLEADLGVGKSPGDGCEGIGGTAVFVRAAGVLYTRSRWKDANAELRTEIWKGQFEERLAVALPQRKDLCVSASAPVSAGLHVIRTCHTASSQVPIAPIGHPSLHTQYQLTVLYP
jgi:hypothetical protein